MRQGLGGISLVVVLAFAGEAAAQPKSVRVTKGFTPNPMSLGKMSHEARTNPRELDKRYYTIEANRTTKQPIVALTIDPGVRDLAIVMRADRVVGWLLVAPDGSFDARSAFAQDGVMIELATPQAGVYRLYPLYRTATTATVEVELVDLSRGWNGVETVTVTDLAEPLIRVGKLRDPRRPSVAHDCTVAVADQPDFLLDVKNPIEEAEARFLRPDEGQAWLIVGPLEGKGRRGPKLRCYGERKLGRLHGTYAVWVGDAKDATAVPTFQLLLVAKGTRRPRGLVHPQIPSDLPLERRVFRDYMPFWDDPKADGPGGGIEQFLRAPRQVFVYAKTTLDPKTAHGAGGGDGPHRFPQAGEPLLVDRGSGTWPTVLSADGVGWSVDPNVLGLTPPATLWIPEEPRVIPGFDALVERYGNAVAKELTAWKQAEAKANTCYYAYWSKHHPAVSPGTEIFAATVRGGKLVKVESFTEKVHKQASAKCGLAKVEKLALDIKKKASALYVADRKKDLAQVRERFAGTN